MNKEQLVSLLKQHKMTVIFTKNNGEERRMYCTLLQECLPERVETNSRRYRNPSHISVFDLEKKEWRSFKYDSINMVSYYENGSQLVTNFKYR